MADRSFFVRLNLDDMADSLDALDSTEERGMWLEGFRVGSRGKPGREGWTEAKRLGHEFGIHCWEKAQEFREKQAAKGKASAASRRGRTECEQDVNHGSTTVQPDVNHGSAGDEPIQKPEAIIQETNNEQHPPTPRGGGPSEVVALWNQAVEGTNLPKARVTSPRSKAIATRLRERGWLDDFRQALAFLVGSEWHRGANDRGWIADLDYLLRPGKATQLAEKARSTGPPPARQNSHGRHGVQWNGFRDNEYAPSDRRGPNGEQLI